MSMFLSPGWWVGFVRAGRKTMCAIALFVFAGWVFSVFGFFLIGQNGSANAASPLLSSIRR
jgi:hypothetical protein